MRSTTHTAHVLYSAYTAHTPHAPFGARLLKLEIPVFTGEPLYWQPFWDCFCSCHRYQPDTNRGPEA